MTRYLCGCVYDEATCGFDEEHFPICPDHEERLQGWRSTPKNHAPAESASAREKREHQRRVIEGDRRG